MNDKILGDNLILSIWNGSTAYEPVACLTSNELNVTKAVIEAQTKCEPGLITRKGGSSSSEISFEAIYIKNEAGKVNAVDLMDFINTISDVPVEWKLSTDQTTPVAYYGSGVLTDLSLSAPAGDEFATFSGTIQNSGLIVTTDPNA